MAPSKNPSGTNQPTNTNLETTRVTSDASAAPRPLEGRSLGERLKDLVKYLSGYRTRALAFAAVGLLLNAYGATHGRREWIVRYDGSFYQAAAAKLLKPVVTLSLGFGAPNVLLSGVTCLVLLIGIVFGRPLLCLPSLLLSVCELAGDVSDALVAAGLLLAHLGIIPAALYSAVAILVISLELFLWHGVLMFYESGFVERIRRSCVERNSVTGPQNRRQS